MTPPFLEQPPPAPSPIPTAGSTRPAVGKLNGGQIAMLLAVSLIGTLALSIAATLIGLHVFDWQPGGIGLLLASLLTQPFLLIGACYLFAIHRWNLTWSDLGLRPVAVKWFFIAFGAWLLSMPVIGGLKTLADWALGTPDSNPYAEFIDPSIIDNPAAAVLIVFLGGIAVPFAEELLFRGLLYPWLRSRLNLILAIALSAVFFSLLHLQLVVLLPILFMGAVLALLREKSGSIWPPMTYHALQNTVTFVILLTGVA